MAIAEGRTVPVHRPRGDRRRRPRDLPVPRGRTRKSSPRPASSARSAPTADCRTSRCCGLRYVPSNSCVELKSLKYYVTSYRSVGIFQEHATARLAEDLFRLLAPQKLVVTTVYNTRGGFRHDLYGDPAFIKLLEAHAGRPRLYLPGRARVGGLRGPLARRGRRPAAPGGGSEEEAGESGEGSPSEVRQGNSRMGDTKKQRGGFARAGRAPLKTLSELTYFIASPARASSDRRCRVLFSPRGSRSCRFASS